jgi:proteasome alpha subunit
MEPDSIEKIFQIDEHIGCATSGLVADARALVDYARIASQINKVTYDEKISVDLLVKKICDFKQNYTQYGGVRPFGTALLVGGWDETGSRLFETDPSGALVSYKAGSIGAGRNTVLEMFEEQYREDLTFDEAVIMGLSGLQQSKEEKLDSEMIEIGFVKEDETFAMMEKDEVKKFLDKLET